MMIEKIYEKFIEDFWSKQCCSGPCSNTQDSDYLEGADALYNFIQSFKYEVTGVIKLDRCKKCGEQLWFTVDFKCFECGEPIPQSSTPTTRNTS